MILSGSRSRVQRLASATIAVLLVLSMNSPGIMALAAEVAPPDAVATQTAPGVVEPAPPEVVAPEAVAPETPVEPAAAPEAASAVSEETPKTASADTTLKAASVSSTGVGASCVVACTPNPMCDPGVRIEPVRTGTYEYSDMSVKSPNAPRNVVIKLTVRDTPAGEVFDFTSNYRVASVVAKGGSADRNVYEYDPAVISGTGLHAPMNPSGKWADLSFVDFCFGTLVRPGSIEGQKFNDLDGDGRKDSGEPMIAGWTVTLKQANGTPIASKLTDADGKVVFSNLDPGTYMLQEEMRFGWDATGPDSVEVKVDPGSSSTICFGNHELPKSSICAYKFRDVNGNGEWDEGELPVEGWMMTLKDAEGSVVATAATNAMGAAMFDDLSVGSYTVIEGSRVGWEPTTPTEMAVRLPVGGTEHVYFGNRMFGSITAYKFSDLNSSGIWDEGELGVPGWTITLHDAEGTLIGSELTDADGMVMFDNLTLGRYTVAEGSRDGWEPTTPASVIVSLAEGQPLTVDFGNHRMPVPGTITAYKYSDLNSDATWDEGEPAVAGWTMTLRDAAGAVVATGLTDVDGMVVFNGVLPGSYTVEEGSRAGWTPTTLTMVPVMLIEGQPQSVYFGNHEIVYTKTFELSYPKAPAGLTFSVNYMLNGEPVTLALTGTGPTYTAQVPVKYPFTIADIEWMASDGVASYMLGASADEVLRGNVTNSFTYDPRVSGYKFDDQDGNGVWDEGEPGLAGWTIYLYKYSPQVAVSAVLPISPLGSVLVASTTTAADGSYSFEGMLPGMYYMAEEMQTGWLPTLWPTTPVTVVSDTAATGLNFGNSQFAPFTEIDLAIIKLADRITADPGNLITYTLTYWNNGETEASDFTITDDFDERYVAVVDANGGIVADGKITWTMAGPLAAVDGPKTLTYSVRVITDMPDGTTNVDNTVVISHPRDIDLSNNTDSERVVVDNPLLPFTETSVSEFLPFTGATILVVSLIAIGAVLMGMALRKRSQS